MIADRPDSLPPFSIASDASNHGTTKLFPLALRYYTPDLGVQNKLLDFYDDFNENSDAIFNQVVSKLEERNLGLERISAYSADNASVNYGVHNSVYKKLTDRNASIIKANCMAHILHNCGRHAGDNLRIDIENIVTKVYNHFSSSAKRVQELKEVFEFVDEKYTALYKNVPTRWLKRCPSALWKLLANVEDGEDVPCELQAYLMFLQNSLKVFFDAVFKVEGDQTTVCELFELMTNLKLKLTQREKDRFFGLETSTLLQQFPTAQAAVIEQDFLTFKERKRALAYVNKWFDFTDGNLKHISCLAIKRELSFQDLRGAAEALKMSFKLDMNQLYDEFCILLPGVKEIATTTNPVASKWTALLKHVSAPNMTALASLALSIPVTNAFVERVFSLMTTAWTETRNRATVELIKSELLVKVNYSYTC
ncbi:hypothetical protein DPX16_15187 [Anabarilius grahami]|uniref:HAT C-terminal dimerisation domain-containing protein n=1 Tax=Anabarilius grahami TaxID=495550 RepID=A0A3N0YVB8_ANAGA|nr:hypothetical protein DPX16_15187 [Anabarilius grahami]